MQAGPGSGIRSALSPDRSQNTSFSPAEENRVIANRNHVSYSNLGNYSDI